MTQENVITDADFYKVDVSGSTVTLSADQEELDKLKDLGMNNAWLVEHDIKEMTNSGNFFANALIYGNEALDAYYGNAEAEWKKIAEAEGINADDKNTAQYKAYWAAKDGYVAESEIVGSNMAVFGGAFTTALDVNDQVTAAVSRRTSAQRTEGFTPWVDVFGTTNEAKRLYGNGAGYEADIYGAVLGFDYTAACGGTLGVALTSVRRTATPLARASRLTTMPTSMASVSTAHRPSATSTSRLTWATPRSPMIFPRPVLSALSRNLWIRTSSRSVLARNISPSSARST